MTDLQPGPALDKLFFERVEGLSVRQITDTMPEWVEGRDWALPGDYVIDVPNGTPYLCPCVSEENSEALAALERFAEKRGVGYTIERTVQYPEEWRYSVALHDAGGSHAPTLAHAIVLAVLATVEEVPDADRP